MVSGGTFDYMAPELGLGAHATLKSDIFSLGLTIFDTFFTPSIDGDDTHNNTKSPTAIKRQRPLLIELVAMTKAGAAVTIPPYANNAIDKELRDLLGRMLSLDPAQRPTASEVLAHPLFQLHLKPEGKP